MMIEKYDHHDDMTPEEHLQVQAYRSAAATAVCDYLHSIRRGHTLKVVQVSTDGGFEMHLNGIRCFHLDEETYVLNELIRELTDQYREMCAILGDPGSPANRERLSMLRSEEPNIYLKRKYTPESNSAG